MIFWKSGPWTVYRKSDRDQIDCSTVVREYRTGLTGRKKHSFLATAYWSKKRSFNSHGIRSLWNAIHMGSHHPVSQLTTVWISQIICVWGPCIQEFRIPWSSGFLGVPSDPSTVAGPSREILYTKSHLVPSLLCNSIANGLALYEDVNSSRYLQWSF